jgi:hypothetical protein
MRRRGTVRRAVVPAVVFVTVAVALAGCVPAAPTPTKTATTITSSASPTAEAPAIDLVGTAGQNQAYFDAVNQKFIAVGGDLSGRPFIDELVTAGYPKTNMEVTPDRTSVNLAADNIQFSIRFGTTCLIGQYGNIGYSSTVTKVLGTGRCLVGTTRPIDW